MLFIYNFTEVVGESTGEVKISEAAEKTVYGSTSISVSFLAHVTRIIQLKTLPVTEH